MPPTLTSPIAGRSCQCLQLFDRLSSLLDDKTSSQLISPATCLDEFGRFRLWANNIGAFLSIDQRNSLDFRLRKASKICSRIVEFLEDLSEALDDACSIVSGTRPNRVAIASNTSSGLGLETSEISEIFGTVKDSITSLMQTSIIIRNATPRDRYVKAQSSTRHPFLESFDIAHVGHKFPKVDSEGWEWLKRRLGKAITQRRQYLKYCREHHDKFSQRTEVVNTSSDGKNQFYELGPIVGSQYEAGTVRSAPTSALAPTDASTLHPSRLEVSESMAKGDVEDLSDSYSQTSYATSVQDNTSEGRLHPPGLKDITSIFPFECPYCWTLQGAMNEESWRKHVFADLRPYVCTFEECDLRLFADRHTWFGHELECHRSEWCCRFCSQPPFRSETTMSTHMRNRHAKFSSPTQLPALINASRQSIDRISAAACPLCHWDATLRDLNRHIPSDETLVVTPEQFRKHLGRHMEQLALFALPQSYKYEEENADSNDAAAMAHSDSQSRHLSMGDMSWKTVSSREETFDKIIPDVSTNIVPNFAEHSKDLYPWSQQPLNMSTGIFKQFPLEGAAMSQLCSNEGDLYLQGGNFEDEPIDHDFWAIKTNGPPTCYQIVTKFPESGATNPLGPHSRLGHAALLVGNAFIVFGGNTQDGNILDDNLYLLDTSTKIWSTAVAHSKPSARSCHTLSLLGSSVMVFGGSNDAGVLNDLSALDLSKLQSSPEGTSWETLMPNEQHPNRPLARNHHTMVSWDHKLYLFGGSDRNFYFSDVWEYDSLENHWTELDCSGSIPQSRKGHAAAVVDGVMYIFGGRNVERENLGDLAALVIASRRWYTFQNMGPSPSPRYEHQMCVYNEKIFVVGEASSEGVGSKDLEPGEDLILIHTLDTSKIRFPRARTGRIL